MRKSVRCLLALLVVGVAFQGVGQAQSIGTFRWQLQPFCNIVTVTVSQVGGIYTLDGFDDLCGAPQHANIVGLASFNPDGTVGIGLTAIIAPGGTPVHVDARIGLASLGGPWQDSAGNSGTFVFTPGAGITGPLRPVAVNGIPPGSITAAQLAPGAIGAAHINSSQVQARVSGTCPVGQYLRGIQPNGTVVCEPMLTPNFSVIADDPTNPVGFFTSIAIGTDGLPIISHQDGTARALRVTHCGNAACSAGNVSTTVDDPANEVGSYTSIAIGVDGLPIISHRDNTAQALRVTHCGNLTCTSGHSSTNVDDPADDVGYDTSIAIGTDGLPVIAHRNQTTGEVRVTHCSNTACGGLSTSTTIEDPNAVGTNTSLAIGADGLPIISSWDYTTGGLRVTHCGNVACTAGNSSLTVDALGNSVGQTSAIAIGLDGFPIISHFDANASALRVTHCGNVTCTAGNVSTTVDAPGDAVGSMTSIAIGTDGLPIISHFNSTASALRVTHCGNVDCTVGTVSATVDDPPTSVGTHSSIAIGTDGLPVISHTDFGTGVLRVTKCATKTCQ